METVTVEIISTVVRAFKLKKKQCLIVIFSGLPQFFSLANDTIKVAFKIVLRLNKEAFGPQEHLGWLRECVFVYGGGNEARRSLVEMMFGVEWGFRMCW
jgi:hypothetical protein